MRFFGPMLFALSLSSLITISAQSYAPPDSQQMTLHVTVTTRSGEPVEGLTRDDFTLTDNKHPDPITDLRALTGATTGVVIVLDAVNLPYNQVSFARQQLAQFFSSNTHLAQPTTLGVLQDKGLQLQPNFTTDGNVLRSALDQYSIGLRVIPQSTGLYGAEERLDISFNTFRQLVTQLSQEGRKQIIWISPGWPLLGSPGVEMNPSQRAPTFANFVAVTTELRLNQIVVDAVNPVGASQDVGQTNFYETFLRAPRKPGDIQFGQLGLQVIAQQSGGLVLNGSNDIASLIQRALTQNRDGYELTFTPPPGERENEYHELHVNVRRPGLVVRTSAGYYARPVFPAAPPQSAVTPPGH